MIGCILISRKLVESEIWKKPPLYIKVWLYLLIKAQHTDYKGLKRGQVFTSIPEIQEACSWCVGYRKETPSKDQIYKILEWLRSPNGKKTRNSCESNYESDTNATMITTTKSTRGIVVNIENYNVYQDFKNYESDTESKDERVAKELRKKSPADTINKNDKNVKNDKNIKNIYGEFQNVKLTDAEFEKLKASFPDYQERIERLSAYIASTGKKYKSHYATILNWARKDNDNGTVNKPIDTDTGAYYSVRV
jgi:hypothetical protein